MWKKNKPHGYGKLFIGNATMKYGMWKYGNLIFVFKNQEEFDSKLTSHEIKYKKSFAMRYEEAMNLVCRS